MIRPVGLKLSLLSCAFLSAANSQWAMTNLFVSCLKQLRKWAPVCLNWSDYHPCTQHFQWWESLSMSWLCPVQFEKNVRHRDPHICNDQKTYKCNPKGPVCRSSEDLFVLHLWVWVTGVLEREEWAEGLQHTARCLKICHTVPFLMWPGVQLSFRLCCCCCVCLSELWVVTH